MKVLVTLDNSKLLVLNDCMQVIDQYDLLRQPRNKRSIFSICQELRTELLKKAVSNRDRNKSFILKLSYHKADALWQYLTDCWTLFPKDFRGYELNAILQIKNELHRQLL